MINSIHKIVQSLRIINGGPLTNSLDGSFQNQTKRNREIEIESEKKKKEHDMIRPLIVKEIPPKVCSLIHFSCDLRKTDTHIERDSFSQRIRSVCFDFDFGFTCVYACIVYTSHTIVLAHQRARAGILL